jgi:glycosyltransferase involved in cell wall biosynthesis
VTVHCSLSHTLQVRDLRTALLRMVGGRIERSAERRAAATIVFTSRLANLLARDVGCSVHVMRRGIDRQAFSVPDGVPFPDIPGRPRIVFVGRVVRHKGVETLVEAAARMRTPGAQIVLVGDGRDRPRVERLARRLGIADRVHVTGFVAHERVPAVLASADLLVLPSFYEELGTVLVEAMQVGLPTVASRVGGIPEVVEDGVTGLLVAPEDPAALAAAMDAVLSDPALARRLGANAIRNAPEYDLERVAGQVHGLYQQLVDENRVRHPRAAEPLARWPALSLWSG